MNPTREAVLNAVDVEEELNGEMPEEMLEYIEKGDSKAVVDALRATIKATKQNIRKRIEELYHKEG